MIEARATRLGFAQRGVDVYINDPTGLRDLRARLQPNGAGRNSARAAPLPKLLAA